MNSNFQIPILRLTLNGNGTAWQEEPPPALNVVIPFAWSGVWAGAVTADRIGGVVNHQKAPRAAAPASTEPRKNRRDIPRSVTIHLNLTTSMAAILAIHCLKI